MLFLHGFSSNAFCTNNNSMAKKKGTKPKSYTTRKKSGKRRKKKKNYSFLSSLQRILFWAILVTALFIGLMYLYDYFYPETGGRLEKPQQQEEVVLPAEGQSKAEEILPAPEYTTEESTSVISLRFPENAEIPVFHGAKREQIVYHEGYTVSYNSDYKIANWVAWELTEEEARSTKAERSNKFISDPKVKGGTARSDDYTRTGYDRGHLAPAGDMKWSDNAMRESFYLSNICPQDPALNRGVWKKLEEQSRLWALDHKNLMIVAGPVITDSMKRLGKNRVGVPKHFYKVICTISDNRYQGVAFLLENRDYKNTSLYSLAIPIDSVEKITGIDFFHNLPDHLEESMESTVDMSFWSF